MIRDAVTEKAENALREAVSSDPDDLIAKFNLGIVCLARGNRDCALSQYNQLKMMDHSLAKTLFNTIFRNRVVDASIQATMSMWVFTHGICVVSRFPKFSPNLKITIECNRYFSGSAIPQRQILFGGDVDLFQTLNRSRTILSVLVHICAFASVVVACAYTFRALALVPFSFGALLGAIFYLVLLLIVWD